VRIDERKVGQREDIMIVGLDGGTNSPRSPSFEIQITMEAIVARYAKAGLMMHVP